MRRHESAGMGSKILRHCRKGAYLLLGFAVVAGPAATGWPQPMGQMTINYIEATPDLEKQSNRISAYVTVSGEDGRPVTGLALEDFNALEDGRPVKLDSVSLSHDPMAVVLAIDTSGSMLARNSSGKTSIAAAKKAATAFISQLSAGDRVAIYTFDNETFLQLDFTADHGAAVRAVKAISATPNAFTRLYDTAVDAVKKAAEIPKGRRAIILVTDGKDEKAGGLPCSIHRASDVIDAATTQSIRVPIYTIGAGPKVDASVLGRISSLTGGHNLLAGSSTELVDFYETIARQLKNQYLLRYRTRAPSGEHSLVVKAATTIGRAQDEKRFWSPPLPVLRPPSVKLLLPAPDTNLHGTVPVKLELTPETGIAKIRYFVDGVLKAENRTPPLDSFDFDTTGLTAGLHLLRVEAINALGQIGAAEMTVTVSAPSVTILYPDGATPVTGTIDVKTRIESENALLKVRFLVDGVVQEEKTNAPFDVFSWKTTGLAPGQHILGIEAIDVHGQTGSTESISVVGIPASDTARRNDGSRSSPGVWIALFLLLTMGAAAIYWGVRKRSPAPRKDVGAPEGGTADTPRPIPQPEEDETVFISDVFIQGAPPPATLTVTESPGIESGKSYEIVGNVKIGRHLHNEIHLPDKSISRKHAEIYFDGTTYYLRDLGSKYGTIVNRHRVSLDVCSLFNGAQINLGPRTTLEFSVSEPVPPPGPDDATLQSAPTADPDDATVQVDTGGRNKR